MSRQRPLSSPQHERALLGALFSDPQSLALVRGVLAEPHFTSTEAVTVWASLCEQWDAGIEISSAVVANALERKGFQDSYDFIGSCINEFSDPSDVEALADILEDWRLRRHLDEVGKRLVRRARAWDGHARQLLTLAQQHLNEADLRCSGPVGRDLAATVGEVWASLYSAQEGQQGPILMTGLPAIDRCLSMRPGQLGIIEGRTSEGKSALANQIALVNDALGRKVALRCLEMTRHEMSLRSISQLFAIPNDLYKDREVAARHAEVIQPALEKLGTRPYLIEDEGRSDPGSILGWMSRLHALAQMDIFIIDHAGLVEYPGTDLRKEMAAFGAALKRWAIAKRVLVILLAQLTDVEPGKTPGRPVKGQTRDCRDLEHVADWILATWLPGKWDEARETEAEIGILKQRNGWTGPLRFRWEGPTTRFLPLPLQT